MSPSITPKDRESRVSMDSKTFFLFKESFTFLIANKKSFSFMIVVGVSCLTDLF